MPLRPTADRFDGCFCLGSGPVFGLFWCCFLFASFSAGETQVWLGDLRVVAFCVVVVFVGFIDLLISRTYVLVQSFSCLLSCKDRAFSATSANLEEQKKIEIADGKNLKIESTVRPGLAAPQSWRQTSKIYKHPSHTNIYRKLQ